MRSFSLVALATVGIMWGCAETPEPTSTSADLDLRYAKPVAGPCNAAVARTISSQQADLYSKPALDVARSLFSSVTSQCSSNPPGAHESMMLYVQWGIDNLAAIKVSDKETALMNHWRTVFEYLGYSGLNVPSGIPVSVFSSGGIGVIGQQTAPDARELRDGVAAMTVPFQDENGDPRSHLFVLYPLNDNCLGTINLRRVGPCYEFGAFPQVSPKFSPRVKVGVCTTEETSETAALGHRKNSNFVEIPEQEQYPAACFPGHASELGSWTGGFGDVVKRLAWHTRRTFGVQNAYAVHGGLGGLGDRLSPFGGVDLEVFRATFENETIGSEPDTPELGEWDSVGVTPPGSIVVQSSLGNSNTGKLVVLNQAGGACKKCGGLMLRGRLHVEPGASAPTNGIYEVSFVALQNGPTMKKADFKMTASNGSVIAQVSFDVVSNQNRILFNNIDTGVRWSRYVPITFRVRIELGNDRTLLYINGDLSTPVLDTTFLQNASNFSFVAADFAGIDSGTMGWDEIVVERAQDP